MSNGNGIRESRRSNAASTAALVGARKLKCPACDRQAALGQKVEWDNGDWVRVCRYCGHQVGRTDGVYYGRG